MKVIRKELPRDQKNCYAVTAWMSIEELDEFTLEVKDEYEEDATVETDSAIDAILTAIGIDYAAEKELKFTDMIDSSGSYFTEYYGDLFQISFPCADGNGRYTNYMIKKYEHGQEAYEIILDKKDPFIGKVRTICDRIMEEFESLGEDGDYWSDDFMESYRLYVAELRKENIEWKSEAEQSVAFDFEKVGYSKVEYPTSLLYYFKGKLLIKNIQ